MAIVVNKHTKIESISECPFDHKAPSKRFTKINNIDDISDFTLVSIIGKLHIRSQQSEVKVQERSVMKLDCNIGDDTGAIKLTLWDKYIPLVQEGQVYEIVNARARGLFLAWVGQEWPLFQPQPEEKALGTRFPIPDKNAIGQSTFLSLIHLRADKVFL